MHDDEAFSRLVGEIYDAALYPSAWPGAIKQATDFVGAAAGWLMTRDSAGRPGVFPGFGGQPHYRQLYCETYIRLDPVDAVLPRLNPGQVVSDSSVTPRAEFLKTRFYEEWIRPQGWLDRAFIILDRSPDQIIAFVIARSAREGWADDGVYERMRLIAPHLYRSVLVCQAVGFQRIEARTLVNTLDGLSAGVLLIDRDGQLVHVNASGADMLSEGLLPGTITAKFSAHEPKARQALFEVLARAAKDDTALAGNEFAIPLKSPKGDRYVAHFLPLTSGTRRESGGYEAVAAVFIQKAALTGPGLAPVIARHYKLTPAETRVLLTIVQAESVQEAASTLGVAATTVKTHLRRVFTKTQTSGQVELVKLVAGFSSIFSQ